MFILFTPFVYSSQQSLIASLSSNIQQIPNPIPNIINESPIYHDFLNEKESKNITIKRFVTMTQFFFTSRSKKEELDPYNLIDLSIKESLLETVNSNKARFHKLYQIYYDIMGKKFMELAKSQNAFQIPNLKSFSIIKCLILEIPCLLYPE